MNRYVSLYLVSLLLFSLDSVTAVCPNGCDSLPKASDNSGSRTLNDILQAYSERRARISVPTSLDEAITRLDAEWSDDDKKTFAAIPEDMIGRRYHMGAGRWIRNYWGLWHGSVLAEYFNRLGIVHPDDMSAIILTSFHRKLNGEDIRLKEQVKRYKAYWKQQKNPKRKKEKIKRYRANHIAHPRQIVAILSER